MHKFGFIGCMCGENSLSTPKPLLGESNSRTPSTHTSLREKKPTTGATTNKKQGRQQSLLFRNCRWMTHWFASRLVCLMVVAWVLYKSQTKLSVPISLRDYTLTQRLLTSTEETHQGTNIRIFTFVLASLCSRSKALGKLPVDRAQQTRLSPLQSTHTKVFIGQRPVQVGLSIASTASELLNK